MSTEPVEEEPFLYIYRLKLGAGPEYDRRHANVWPELLKILTTAGISDYQIWRHEEIVVCRLRARNGFIKATAILSSSEVQQKWSASLADLFESVVDTEGQPLWLNEVFRFDS